LLDLRIANSGHVKWIYFRALGLIYCIAFCSFAVQAPGLIGAHGILPAEDFFRIVSEQLGVKRFWEYPTLNWWIGTSGGSVIAVAWSGVIVSLLLFAGCLETPALIFLWAAYLSVCTAGQDFLQFQWDSLLLETGFLSIFVSACRIKRRWPKAETEPNPVGWWLLRWLTFRLMLQSGLVKLWSGDSTWRDGTALAFHYETQPLPTWVGWIVHQMPLGFHKGSLITMFAVELVVPWMIFGPRKWRIAAGVLFIALQVVIMLTGNYGFFNLLAIALCLPLFDDSTLPRRFSCAKDDEAPLGNDNASALSQSRRARRFGVLSMIPVAVLVVLVTLLQTLIRGGVRTNIPKPTLLLMQAIDPFRSLNSYGLFAVMTTTRGEISMEGSDDGVLWRPYLFVYKPGEPDRRPNFVLFHMPRLDWQMWFAALGSLRGNPWLVAFQKRLLEGTPEVLGLLRENPFPAAPPRYVRTQIARYQFASVSSWRESGDWWVSEKPVRYGPVLMLRKGELSLAPQSDFSP
jgi:lipase maturation factor 1